MESSTELRRKMLELYKRLLSSFRSLEDIMDIYVEYLKLMVQFGDEIPIYRKYPGDVLSGNCYTYALDLKCPIIFQGLYSIRSLFKENGVNLNVGFISAVQNKTTISCYSEKELLENLYADLDALKIKVFDSEINKAPSHDGYKIYVFKDTLIHSNGNFHFVRRNIDGSLSHRNGYDGGVKRIRCLKDVHSSFELVKTLEIVKPNQR